jgi:ABC-2 type transport system permease protein
MNMIVALVRKDIRLFLTDRMSVALTFFMPLAMIVIFGYVFGGGGGDHAPIPIIGINHSTDPVAATIMNALDSTTTITVWRTYKSDDPSHTELPFTDSVATSWVKEGKVTAAFIIPADALTDTSQGLKLTLLYDARNEIETQLLQGTLRQAIYTKTPRLFLTLMRRAAKKAIGLDSLQQLSSRIISTVGKFFNVDTARMSRSFRNLDSTVSNDTALSNRSSRFFSGLVRFDTQQLVGTETVNPMVTRSIGGWAIMFVLFSLTGASRALIEERDMGTLHRLLTTPLTRGAILFAKSLYMWMLGVVQILALFVFGSLIFSVNIYSNFFNLLVMIVLSSGAATAFGMFLASIAKTSAQANGLSTILILSMSALGGSWFPVSFMPPFIQSISRFTLTYWSVEGFLSVLWRNVGIMNLLPNIGVLCAIIVVLTGLSVWRFRKSAN